MDPNTQDPNALNLTAPMGGRMPMGGGAPAPVQTPPATTPVVDEPEQVNPEPTAPVTPEPTAPQVLPTAPEEGTGEPGAGTPPVASAI